VLGITAGALKRAVIFLPHDGGSVDQNPPALLGGPSPVLDIHAGVEDGPGEGLAN
jgi:hypothetical protein